MHLHLIVAVGSPPTRAALDATNVPVVFIAGDPIAAGFAASLAKPGGRATGLSVVYTELVTKQIDLLRQLVPRAKRIGHLTNSSNPVATLGLEEARNAARTLGVRLVTFDARNTVELDASLHAIQRRAVDAVLVSGELMLLANKTKIAQSLRKSKVPAMFPFKDYHEDGELMSYGPNLRETMRRVATYVDKIIKGASPSEIPIEQVSKYELVVDRRLARELGIEIPQSILVRADEVIR